MTSFDRTLLHLLWFLVLVLAGQCAASLNFGQAFFGNEKDLLEKVQIKRYSSTLPHKCASKRMALEGLQAMYCTLFKHLWWPNS